jgi:hypothetical protein
LLTLGWNGHHNSRYGQPLNHKLTLWSLDVKRVDRMMARGTALPNVSMFPGMAPVGRGGAEKLGQHFFAFIFQRNVGTKDKLQLVAPYY